MDDFIITLCDLVADMNKIKPTVQVELFAILHFYVNILFNGLIIINICVN